MKAPAEADNEKGLFISHIYITFLNKVIGRILKKSMIFYLLI